MKQNIKTELYCEILYIQAYICLVPLSTPNAATGNNQEVFTS